MKKIFLFAICSSVLFSCDNDKKEDANGVATTGTTATSAEKKSGDELLDMSTCDPVKSSYMAFSKGDIDGMTANYDDNIRYNWSGGDSIIGGKKGVQDYWKKRWSLIDSLSFSEHIMVPINMKVQQSEFAPLGKWVLFWTMANVKYKNGNKLTFWMHSVNHLNDAGKIDFVGNYYDRAPINKVTEGMTLPK